MHKDALQWVSGSRTQTVTTSGSYTLNAYETSAADTKILKIPRTRDSAGTVNGYYYLEYRKPTSTWNQFLGSGRADYGNGVLVHTSGAHAAVHVVLRARLQRQRWRRRLQHRGHAAGDRWPGTADFNDAPLLPGESYTDTGAGVTIRCRQRRSLARPSP